MKKLLGVAILVLLAAGLGWRIVQVQRQRAATDRKSVGSAAKALVPVVVVTVASKAVPVEIATFGNVEARAMVTVKPQVTGVLSEVAFTEGQEVAAGDTLARIDARPFEAALHQAEAALARTQAQRMNAAREARRQADLFQKGFVAESDRDQAQTALIALLASERADTATVDRVRLDLGYCTITAPIAGRTGQRLADAGNVVTANTTPLVAINRIRPTDVRFTVPQQELPRLRACAGAGGALVEASPLGDDAPPEQGRLFFVDNAVDRATGTVTLKAEFANDASRLWPGQFVTVRVVVSVETNALTIPSKAVQSGQAGVFVFVAGADDKVELRPVTIARQVGEESVIAAGLQAGERVVAEGQTRLGPGSKVKVKGAAEPGVQSPEAGVRKSETGSGKPGRAVP